jgi:hypothetical protein
LRADGWSFGRLLVAVVPFFAVTAFLVLCHLKHFTFLIWFGCAFFPDGLFDASFFFYLDPSFYKPVIRVRYYGWAICIIHQQQIIVLGHYQ